MARFDASYQIRVGLRGIPSEGIKVGEGETAEITSEGAPTIDEITATVEGAIEGRWPDFAATVYAERLDRD